MRIVITGASGYIGRHTANELLSRGVAPGDLILLTRSADKLAGLAQLGATVRSADFSDPDALRRAFGGGDKAFFISVAPEGLITVDDQATLQENAVFAAASAGIRHGVIQSSVGTTIAPEPRDEVDRRTEAALRSSGMTWTILRTSAFADSRGREAKRNLREGRILSSMGQGRAYYVTRAEIAAAAAAVLASDGHEGKIHNLVGPGVTVEEIVRILFEISGKRIGIAQLDDAAFAASIVERGRLARIAATATLMYKQFREGQAPPPCDLPALIGRPGMPLRDFLQANSQELLTGSPPAGREPVLA